MRNAKKARTTAIPPNTVRVIDSNVVVGNSSFMGRLKCPSLYRFETDRDVAAENGWTNDWFPAGSLGKLAAGRLVSPPGAENVEQRGQLLRGFSRRPGHSARHPANHHDRRRLALQRDLR